MADVLYVNGQWATTDDRVIGVEDRGLQYGDSIYEVLKFLRKRPLFLGDHFRRLAQGLATLEIPNPFDEGSFARLCAELLGRSSATDGLLYVQVTRGEAPRAHFWPEGIAPTVIAYARDTPFPTPEKKKKGIAVITVPETRWKSCFLKSTNLLPNAMAKKAAQRAGAAEALFLDGHEVKEGASSSFFAVRDGRLITHATEPCILPGTVRDLVISIALEARIRVDERPVKERELYQLDEAFITATSQGVMPVTAIDGRQVGEGVRGPLTERLQRAFDELELRQITS